MPQESSNINYSVQEKYLPDYDSNSHTVQWCGHSTLASLLWQCLWPHHKETRELPGERDNARNNARYTQVRKTTHSLDGQHQYVDRTLHGRVNQNDRDKWRKYVHSVANRRIDDGYRTDNMQTVNVTQWRTPTSLPLIRIHLLQGHFDSKTYAVELFSNKKSRSSSY